MVRKGDMCLGVEDGRQDAKQDCHEPHLLRLEDTNTIITTKTFAIPQNSRMRLFQRKAGKWELHCPIARSQMRFQPTMTNDMGEPTVDIFRCLGTAHGHFSHFVKLQHGKIKIGKMEIGILVATRELRKKIDRDYQTKLTKGEYFNLVNRVWKNDVIKYQPNTIHELVKKKLSRS